MLMNFFKLFTAQCKRDNKSEGHKDYVSCLKQDKVFKLLISVLLLCSKQIVAG